MHDIITRVTSPEPGTPLLSTRFGDLRGEGTPISMTDLVEDICTTGTVAQRQAAMLFLLARHLVDHPDLAGVDVYPLTDSDSRELRCHLSAYDGHHAPALHAWARSLPDATITAQVVPGDWLDADVFVRAPLGPDATITVWAKVARLSASLGLLDVADPSAAAVVPVEPHQLINDPFAGHLLDDPAAVSAHE